MNLLQSTLNAIYAAAGMFWMILWALVLGFMISGMVQAFVSKSKMAALLGNSGLKQLGLASFFGAMSSSCSYAASSMARSIFQKGAHIIPTLAFMIASTNLVIELSIVLWVMMGWQFVLAEFLGGAVLILTMATLMRFFGPLDAFKQKQAEMSTGSSKAFSIGENEHATQQSDDAADPRTREGWTRAAQASLMEWRMIWKDILLGVVISGFLMTFVPDSFWSSLFLGAGDTSRFDIAKMIENALIGPVVSMLSFVCSVGNIPLASVLFHGGISFGGAVSFIYADLIIIPLILVYRKYYGWKLALWIVGIFYISMAVTGVAVDLLFTALGWVPHFDNMKPHAMQFFQMNYTFWLNLIFLGIAAALVLLARSAKQEPEHSCCH